MYIKKSDICTIPNLLTMLRIILVPIFIYYYMQDEQLIAAILILACGFTDFLDGYIARHTNAISEVGKMLDPFADKLLQFAIVFVLLFKIQHMKWVFLLFMVKETSMFLCWLYMRKKGGYMNGAQWFGKVSTAVFYVTMFLLLLLPIKNTIYSDILLLITAVFLLISFLLYMKTYFSMFHKMNHS